MDTGGFKQGELPTITIEDVDKRRPANGNGHVPDKDASPASPTSAAWPNSPTSPTSPTSPSETEVPGAMPNGPAPAIPDWYKLGWRDVSGIDHPPLPEGEEKDKEILSQFLKQQYYGDWYHNAALIVVVSGYLYGENMLLTLCTYRRLS